MASMVVIMVVSGGIAGLFMYLAWRRKQQNAAMQQAVLEKGWEMQPVREGATTGFRLKGSQAGVSWSLEALSTAQDSAPGSSPVHRSTCWRSQDARLPGRAVVIGPTAGMGAGGMGGLANPLMNSALLRMGLRAMLGEDAGWVEGLSPAPVGSPALGQRFGVLAHDAQDARRLLDPTVEARLLGLPPRLDVVVKLRETGLEILVRGAQISDPGDLQALIDLGAQMVRSWQAGGAS